MDNRAAKSLLVASHVLCALICALAGAVLFQFFGNATRGYIDTQSLFHWWGLQWTNPGSETEHGWVVLAVSVGLLVWRLRNADCRMPNAESMENHSALGTRHSAFFALLAGLALQLVGFVAQQTRVSIVAFLIFAWGVLRLGGGKRWGDAAAFPLGFMVFSIPINVLDSFGFWLQMGVVKATAAIAHGVGIDVVRNGTQLFAPDGRYQYDVVAACSGVRSLVALTALSVLAGYVSFQGWTRRAVVLLLCFPLVYLGNVARLTTIVIAAQIAGQRAGDIAHEIMGVGVFAIVLGGVLGAVVAMEKWWPERGKKPDVRGQRSEAGGQTSDVGGQRSEVGRQASESGSQGAGGGERRVETTVVGGSMREVANNDLSAGKSRLGSAGSTWIAMAVVVLAVGEMFFLRQVANAPARGGVGVAVTADGVDPVALPAFIGTEWVGRRAEITAIEREILPADTGFSRKVYVPVAEPAKQVLLSLVLSGRDRTSIHRPELCLVGQGWTIEGQATASFNHPEGGTFPATLLRVQREVAAVSALGAAREKTVVPHLVAYWFVSSDRVVATHWERVALDAWNRVAHGRADRWAYVLMQTDASDGEAAALARMQAVLEGTLPAFQPAGEAR